MPTAHFSDDRNSKKSQDGPNQANAGEVSSSQTSSTEEGNRQNVDDASHQSSLSLPEANGTRNRNGSLGTHTNSTTTDAQSDATVHPSSSHENRPVSLEIGRGTQSEHLGESEGLKQDIEQRESHISTNEGDAKKPDTALVTEQSGAANVVEVIHKPAKKDVIEENPTGGVKQSNTCNFKSHQNSQVHKGNKNDETPV